MKKNTENTVVPARKIDAFLAANKAKERNACLKVIGNGELSSVEVSAALTSMGCEVSPRTVRRYRSTCQ